MMTNFSYDDELENELNKFSYFYYEFQKDVEAEENLKKPHYLGFISIYIVSHCPHKCVLALTAKDGKIDLPKYTEK